MTATLYTRHPSPVGPLLLVGERTPAGGTVLTGCYLPDHRRGPAVDLAWTEDRAAFAAIGAALDAELADDPAGEHRHLRRAGRPHRDAGRRASRWVRRGPEPDLHRRAVPPGGRGRRVSHRVRRWG